MSIKQIIKVISGETPQKQYMIALHWSLGKVIDWIEVCHRFLNSCSQAYVVPKYHLFEQAVDVYKFHCWTMRLIKCQIKM